MSFDVSFKKVSIATYHNQRIDKEKKTLMFGLKSTVIGDRLTFFSLFSDHACANLKLTNKSLIT